MPSFFLFFSSFFLAYPMANGFIIPGTSEDIPGRGKISSDSEIFPFVKKRGFFLIDLTGGCLQEGVVVVVGGGEAVVGPGG